MLKCLCGPSRMAEKVMRTSYDKVADVLYVTTRPGVPARSDEGEEPGVIWRYEIDSGELIGATILDFAHYWSGERFSDLVDALADKFGLSRADTRKALTNIH
jgi:uncharacterized protein YuzE